MSRPRKIKAEKRSHPITFWLTTDEFSVLHDAAERAGLRVNDLARRFACRGSRRIKIKVSKKVDPLYIAQLRALGVNLNQLTRRSHITGEVSPYLETLCEEIRQVVFEAAESQH